MKKIAISFDVEDWYHTTMVSGSSFSQFDSSRDFFAQQRGHFTDLITQETARLLDILKSFNIQCTFFMVAEVTDRYPQLVELLKKTNHEIACHSLTHHSALNSKTKDELKPREQWFAELQQAKTKLESVFEREVVGYRAPNAYFANWMVPLLVETGIKYDSSIAYNSIYNKTNVKLEEIPAHPYFLNSKTLGDQNADTELVELPWSRLQINKNLILPAGGAFFFRLLGYRYFSYVLDKALRKHDSMFYMHPLELTRQKIPTQRSINRPLVWINTGRKVEKALIRLLNRYEGRFCPCNEVYQRFVQEKNV